MSEHSNPFDPNPFDLASDQPSPAPISPLWLLAEEYRVVDAALLILGLEPQELAREIAFSQHQNKPIPEGFDAAKAAISSALRTGAVEGTQIEEEEEVYNEGVRSIPGSVDIFKSTVDRYSLTGWLRERIYLNCIFFQTTEKTGFRDPSHPRYSQKLAAVVDAWESFDPNSEGAGTAKQKLTKWLRLSASQYGLTSEDGSPSESVIEELAKVANWATGGGAPKQIREQSGPD